MYSLANVNIDENGVDKSLQIWEYDEENILDFPYYTFSDGFFEPYSIAQDWHWIVERVGFNDDLQAKVEQMLP